MAIAWCEAAQQVLAALPMFYFTPSSPPVPAAFEWKLVLSMPITRI